MNKDNGGFKMLKGLLIGGAIGTAIGMLFAPRSGKETREKLMGEAERLKGELEKYANDFSDKAQELKKDLEQKLAEVKSKIEETADNIKTSARKKEEEVFNSHMN
ncbi:MAG TPA: YtxH domain-containing protein [Saprospiraceae bacterium]|jgi:gas vesicle protein|nr:YtxH domain-containing protein [Saprospiraceae bacterium]HRO09502.1 YtxH domain-containing protein [Saprospiraceae bacterium]HRP42801.1 YtxH domain-containing protein [Saprospiraceae bacterium]